MSAEPEPDQEAGTLHPREQRAFFGHDAQEAALADALTSGRAHHAWLICGPKGVGKATLAYRAARVVLGARGAGPRPLDVAAADPIARRVAVLAHPDLFILRRSPGDRGRLRRDIAVEDARAFGAFFSLKPAEGGWRVAIVDAADDLNRNAANALLKTLEEPPPRSLILMIAHAPGGLLATIKSRCRRLDLRAPGEAAVQGALAAAGQSLDAAGLRLADGRPGRALALAAQSETGHVEAALAAIAKADRDPRPLQALAGARPGDGAARLTAFLDLAQDWCRRAAAHGVGAPLPLPELGDAGALMRLADPARASAWARAYQRLGEVRDESEGLGLDPAHAYSRAAAILVETARGK